MSNPEKKGFGVYATCVSALLSLAAGILFQVVNGRFGTVQRNAYTPWIVGLLIGAFVVAGGLVALKKYGLASACATAMPFAAICIFAHRDYWYIVDVFMDIDEHGFDPKFIAFAALAAAAVIVGEIAIYARKTKKIKT